MIYRKALQLFLSISALTAVTIAIPIAKVNTTAATRASFYNKSHSSLNLTTSTLATAVDINSTSRTETTVNITQQTSSPTNGTIFDTINVNTTSVTTIEDSFPQHTPSQSIDNTSDVDPAPTTVANGNITSQCASSPNNNSLATLDDEGRPGKIPYRRFPKCYVECFDSEGTDDKTWPAIGDIRDLTTHEFCHSQWVWVGNWMLEHLQFCVAGYPGSTGRCEHCRPQCHQEAKKVMDSLCGTPG
ncbi:hypothetical protein JX266_006434 [Neoarthrinium moseri]|uniref:uncharacterized protein n=1 Tax=Neoarthrinium moseri TaxID=1658444 RepID=UPI001FDD9297|nr:uncharacterized protein JN550_007061 [Neoarthrinium moseri]KAI1847582.1 hypothetical protein JX266_006434 [Neoarthrinium moseri]KAI1867330.1 hypothetical protein JN550_007061 [Neoarthrinium moseri]